MNFEQFIYSKLSHYEASPPSNMWSRIVAGIDGGKKKRPIYYYNQEEKKLVLYSIIGALGLCTALFQYISPRIQPQTSTIQYTSPILAENIQKPIDKISSSIANSSLSTHNKFAQASSSNTTKHYQSNKKKVALTTSEQKFVQDHKNEIKILSELAQINKKIDSIETVQWSELNYMERKDRTILASVGSPPVLVNSEINSIYPLTAPIEEKPTETTSALPYHKGYYITPFIGGNFTQIFYQDQPNNPFFSDKAVFTGKIGYNFGTQIGYQFSKHWSMEGGISYGQYIQSFRENITSDIERKGQMYIDQLDFPLMARYSIHFGSDEFPKSFSFKSGLVYNSVTQYQVNYIDVNKVTNLTSEYKYDADKRLYNSLQLGYVLGFDLDAFLSKKISLNLSMLNALVSQVENFPLFSSDKHRPIQFSTGFSIGTKIRF